MPSTAWPWETFSSSSASSGWCGTSAAARSRTWASKSSSRQGLAVTSGKLVGVERWSATVK